MGQPMPSGDKQAGIILCIGCRYRLDHLECKRCPECGRSFDPCSPSTYTTAARIRAQLTNYWATPAIVLGFLGFWATFAILFGGSPLWLPVLLLIPYALGAFIGWTLGRRVLPFVIIGACLLGIAFVFFQKIQYLIDPGIEGYAGIVVSAFLGGTFGPCVFGAGVGAVMKIAVGRKTPKSN